MDASLRRQIPSLRRMIQVLLSVGPGRKSLTTSTTNSNSGFPSPGTKPRNPQKQRTQLAGNSSSGCCTSDPRADALARPRNGAINVKDAMHRISGHTMYFDEDVGAMSLSLLFKAADLLRHVIQNCVGLIDSCERLPLGCDEILKQLRECKRGRNLDFNCASL